MTELSSWLVSEIGSIILNKSIDNIFSQSDPRLKSAQNAVLSILQGEQNNDYYNTLDTVLHNSALLKDAYNQALHDESKAKQRIQECLITNGVHDPDAHIVSGVMLRILNTIKNTLLTPNPGEEQRLASRIESVHQKTHSIHSELLDTKRDISQIITKIGINELSDSQYACFEQSIISYYLNGELSVLSDTLLRIKEWSIENKAQLPTNIQSLCYMLESISKYCKTSQMDDDLLSKYCNTPSTPELDKLFISFVLSFGTRAQIILLKDNYPKDRIAAYLPAFEAVLSPIPLDLSIVFSDNDLRPVYASIFLARNYNEIYLSSWKHGLQTAEEVLPKPFVIAYLSILEHNTLTYQYVEYPLNPRVERICSSILGTYSSVKPFFESCSTPLQRLYFDHFVEILITCPKDVISEKYSDICTRPIHKDKLLFLKARISDNAPDTTKTNLMDEALEEAISSKNYSSILKLLRCALQTISKSYVIDYLNEHLFLLKKDISILSLALDIGFPSETLDRYSADFERLPEYYLLCIQHKSPSDNDLEKLETKALEAYRESNKLRGFDNIVSLVIIARKHNEFDALEASFGELPIAIHRCLAHHFYKSKQFDSALFHIRKVINTDSTTGDDYLLLGLVSSGDESIAAFQTGYQDYGNVTCLGNLLTAQYQHNLIKQDTLSAASRVDTARMQSLVAAAYSSLGNQSSAFAHCIRALLLTNEYDAQIYNQAFQSIISHEHGHEYVPSNIGSDTCVFLEDDSHDKHYVFFYPESIMVPNKDCYWCNIHHIWADYSNGVYASLVTRPIGSIVMLDGKQFKVVGLSDTYSFISKCCLDKLISHNDVFALSGNVDESIEKIKEFLIDRTNQINECFDQYQDMKSLPIMSLRGLANRFGASYPEIMNSIIQKDIPIRSYIHDQIIHSEEFVVGFDTLFLLSLLDLDDCSLRSICNNLVISESTYGSYMTEKIKTLKDAQESAGYMWAENGRLRLIERNPADPCKPYRDMYDSLDPIVQNVKRKDSVFVVPSVLSEIEHDLSHLYGQETLDAFQMSSDHNCVIINDAALIWLFNNLFQNHRWGTIMDILAQSNLSIESLISCLEKLAQLRFSGIFSFNFFCTLCERLRSLAENDLSEQYENALTKILDVCESTKNESFFFGNLLTLTHALGQSNYHSDPLTKHLVSLAINNTPDSILERLPPLFDEMEDFDPE